MFMNNNYYLCVYYINQYLIQKNYDVDIIFYNALVRQCALVFGSTDCI